MCCGYICGYDHSCDWWGHYGGYDELMNSWVVVPAAPVRHAGRMPPLRQLYAAGGIEVVVHAATGRHANDNRIDPVGTAVARPQLT